MAGTIRARVQGGELELLEKNDLLEGTDVLVTVIGISEGPDDQAFLGSGGSWKGLINGEKLIENIYADRLIDAREEPEL